jgi:hypothetical protein
LREFGPGTAAATAQPARLQQQYDGLGRPAKTIYADGAEAWTAMDQRV